MWPDKQYYVWRNNDRVTGYGIAGFRVNNLVGFHIFRVGFFKKQKKLLNDKKL